MSKLLHRLLPVGDLVKTVKRFPLSVVCAFFMFVLSVMIVHDFIDEDDDILGRVFAILSSLYFWFGISKLVAESNNWSFIKHFIISSIIGITIALLIGFSNVWYMHLMFIMPALLLGIMFAPYIKSGDDTSFWFFNRTMWFGVVVSYAALVMFAGGLSLAMFAIHTLFDVDIDEKIYFDIWLFAAFVLGPLYALSWVPKRFEYSQDDCQDLTGLRFIANWISAPMVFVYLLILYAYFIKIIFSGEVPNGYLAYMISGFAGAGIVTYLLAWPMKNTGAMQLRLFYKVFFPALIIPVGFHFYAIWERVSAYGITEQRYLLMISALWLAILALGNIRSKIPIKAIPMTLAMLLVFASFGPWGGVSLSGVSQFSRLENLLEKHNILQEGKIVKTKEDIPFDDRLSISSILDYLCRSNRDRMLEPLFNTDNKDSWSCSGGYNLTKYLGFDYVRYSHRSQRNDRFYINRARNNFVDISGYDMMLRNVNIYTYSNGKGWENNWKSQGSDEIKIKYNNGELAIYISMYDTIYIDINDFVSKKVDLKSNIQNIVLTGENKDLLYKIDFYSMSGSIKYGKPDVDNMGFNFMYRLRN